MAGNTEEYSDFTSNPTPLEVQDEDGLITTDTVKHNNDYDDTTDTESSSEKDESESYDKEETERLKSEAKERQRCEDEMTEEEREKLNRESNGLKKKGNDFFREKEYTDAFNMYTKSLLVCPLCYTKDRAIMYSNRAACYMKMEKYESAIEDSSKAIELDTGYIKALLRRAELYEKTDKLDEALSDYQRVIELDPSIHSARAACVQLPEKIKDRNEKLKDEMFGKLKELGNLVLKPFGLSTDSFKLQQNPETGSYSINMQNTPKNS